jgi:hypothetical protein
MATLWRLLLCILFPLASGCASTLQVTYTSEPSGAALYQGNTHMGTTPMTLNYQLTEEDKKSGSKNLQGTSVRWVSGASASITYLTADLRIGRNQTFSFRRPDGVPGYDVDANYALQLQRNAIMMLQTAAQFQQAEAARQQAEQTQLLRQQQQQLYVPRQTNCTSNLIGNTIYTNCN